MITQQPGSIGNEILSQGDNWFIFHLLSSVDLSVAKKSNAHFSDDLLSTLMNEPIPGHCVFWSSVGGQPYPLSLRVHLFEDMYKPIDTDYSKDAGATYSITLRDSFTTQLKKIDKIEVDVKPETAEESQIDPFRSIENNLIDKLKGNAAHKKKIESEDGIAWGSLKAFFMENLPKNLDDINTIAYNLVAKAMNSIYGPQDKAWETYKNSKGTTYIRLKK